MSMIDIKNNYKQYSPSELRSYAYSGHIVCSSTDLSDFLEYIFTDFEDSSEEILTQDDVDNAREEGYDSAVNEMRGFLDNM